MRTVLTMAMKDLRLVSRDWLGLFFIVGFPVMMALFFGAMYGSMGGESMSLRVAVVDEDQTEISQSFVRNLTETDNVEVERLVREAAMDRVRRGQLVGMIALPKGFGATAGIPWMESPAIQVGIDPARKAEAGMLSGLVMQAAGRLMITRFQDPGAMRPMVQQARIDIGQADDLSPVLKPVLSKMMDSLDEFMATWDEAAKVEADVERSDATAEDAGANFELARIETIDVTRDLPKDSQQALVRRIRSQWDISFPQAMLWGILACAAGFAVTIVRERKQGTFLRLQVAPVSRAQVLAGKALACFVAVISVIGLMVALGIGMGMRPENPSLLVAAAVCIAFAFAGIMMLMSVLGKTEEGVSGAAWGGNMLMAMFGGGMMPLVFMPSFMKTLSDFSPAKWSVLALEGAIWRGFSWSEMLLPCGILIAVGAVCLGIGTTVLSRATN